MFNVSAFISNSINENYIANITLHIANISGEIFSQNSTDVNLTALSTREISFLNINSTSWQQGIYTLNITLAGNFTAASPRAENLYIKNIGIYASTADYMCNQTAESFEVTLYNPFPDKINYNISLEVPSGWSYSGSQSSNISAIGNSTFLFNITAGTSAAQNITVNATVKYSYPGIEKERKDNETIEENNAMPILSVVRETPSIIGNNRVFESQLTIYNKGCAASSGSTVTESLSTGWTPANPSIKTNAYGTDISLSTTPSTDLEKNVIIWTIGQMPIARYAILTYKIKSPTSTATTGALNYATSWDSGRRYNETTSYVLSTLNYTGEAHLEFRLEAEQQSEFPLPEVRTVQLSKQYNYTLTVTNIGDTNATGWNVTLKVPSTCSIPYIYQSGEFDASSNLVTWDLEDTEVRASKYLNFTANCANSGSFTAIAKGIIDNRTNAAFSNATAIGCSFSSGNSCSSSTAFTFSKPANAKYEKLKDVEMNIYYNFSGAGLTLGEGFVNLDNDQVSAKRIWQNYSFLPYSGTIAANYTLDSNEQDSFVNSTRNIGVSAQADATSVPRGNVSIRSIDYTWDYGKLFEESQNLYMNVKNYSYAALLQNPRVIINNIERNSTSTAAERTGGWG